MKDNEETQLQFNDRLAVVFKDERPAFWVNGPEDALMRVQAFEHAKVAKAEPRSGLRFARVTWQLTTRKIFYGTEHIGWLLFGNMIAAVSRAQQQLNTAEEVK